jgi:2-phospho-L-lactate/phosphoenolpyruvate guanylyltransferase
MKTIAILPVKRLESAHSRLADRLTPEQRKRVAEATFLDMLGKVRRCRTIAETIVVTSDEAVARQSHWLGHPVVRQSEDSGHSDAAAAGVRAANERGADRVAMLPTDCPMFDPAELDDRLGLTPRYALIVPDRAGTGTNALILCPPDAFQPAFGVDSCARHIAHARATGISFALERIESLAVDLDTPEDLEILRDSLLLAPERSLRTAQVLWEVGAAPQPSPSGPTPPETAAAA